MPRLLLGWGGAGDGQLGQPDASIVKTPRLLPQFPYAPDAFGAGIWSSYIVTHSGAAAFVCGRGPYDGPTPLSLVPGTAVPPDLSSLPSISAVAAGRDFAIFQTVSGHVYSIGGGAYGQLGCGSSVARLTRPMRVSALSEVRIVALACSEFHWLSLDSYGRVYACGQNVSGQLGLGHTENVFSPQRVTALFPYPIIAISTGDMHSAVLSATGTILCFGSNKSGQLGQQQFRIRVTSLTPLAVTVPTSNAMSDEDDYQTFVDVACGSQHTLALRSDGALVVWGNGESGQLGTRSSSPIFEPTTIAVRQDNIFVSVYAGERHSAALTNEGVAYMWGDGSQGQLGDGDASDKYFPIPLPAPRPKDNTNSTIEDKAPWRFVRLSCGGFHTLALTANDGLPVFDAKKEYAGRIPRCEVRNMLQPKSGLSRFSSPAVLLRTFVNSAASPLAKDKVDYIAAETEHLKFLGMFGPDGKNILRLAAARIRHAAQLAFGMVHENSQTALLAGEKYGAVEREKVTPSEHFAQSDDFRSSVSNSYESGYLFFLAFMNPIYGERDYVPELAELASIVIRCEENARQAFLEMLSYCDETILVNRIVRPLQAVLTDELRGYRRITRNTIFATKALALCFHAVWRASRRLKLKGFSIPRKEFYNETVSQRVDLEEDYERWTDAQRLHRSNYPELHRNPDGSYSPESSPRAFHLPPLPTAGRSEPAFSFCTYNFLLTESAKFKVLGIESSHTMSRESMRSVLSFGSLSMPTGPWGRVSHMHVAPEQMAHLQYLVLKVQRTNIVSDAFQQIAELASNHLRELHKPLKVIFEGEEGVDEGGVRKDFFQTLLQRILSLEYGMFDYNEETRFHWFRKDFLEPEVSWTLIGIVFGLATFNSILLDVHFPPVVYRKLETAFRNYQLLSQVKEGDVLHLGKYEADLSDVIETFPDVGRSLEQLQKYEGDDVEEVFCLNFEVSYKNMWGQVETHALIENGGNTPVTNSNREKFISLYIEYLINESTDVPFSNFCAGLALMLNGPFINMLTAEELETLVVGESVLDFNELRSTARYEGYAADSAAIVNFWHVVGEYDEESKKLFLSFVTGNDRAPVGGLGTLDLVIQRNGGDSDRLPTSRTCFNTLLLPEYSSLEKMKDRIDYAIRNGKGFFLQ